MVCELDRPAASTGIRVLPRRARHRLNFFGGKGQYPEATAEFVVRTLTISIRYVRFRLAPTYDQVDDLVHEVFLAAWENLPSYQGSRRISAISRMKSACLLSQRTKF